MCEWMRVWNFRFTHIFFSPGRKNAINHLRAGAKSVANPGVQLIMWCRVIIPPFSSRLGAFVSDHEKKRKNGHILYKLENVRAKVYKLWEISKFFPSALCLFVIITFVVGQKSGKKIFYGFLFGKNVLCASRIFVRFFFDETKRYANYLFIFFLFLV